jgi:hypothetical protein
VPEIFQRLLHCLSDVKSDQNKLVDQVKLFIVDLVSDLVNLAKNLIVNVPELLSEMCFDNGLVKMIVNISGHCQEDAACFTCFTEFFATICKHISTDLLRDVSIQDLTLMIQAQIESNEN